MEEIIVASTTFTNKALQKATDRIYKMGNTIRKCTFEISAIMAQVEESECYKDDGFNSVHDWAMKTFGFKKSASYTLLKIGKEYISEVINEKNGRIEGYRTNLLPDDSELDFSSTQIEKMLPGGHDLAVKLVSEEEITPDMTCKQISSIIKAYTSTDEEVDTEETDTEEADTEEADTEEADSDMVWVYDDNGDEYLVPKDVLKQYKKAK